MEKIEFDEKAYTYLGTINGNRPGEAEERVYRSKLDEKEYCLVKYISGMPAYKNDFSSGDMELKLKDLLSYENANREQIVRIIEQEFPMCIHQLSELRSAGSENVPLPQLTDDNIAALKPLSAKFFSNWEPVLQRPSEDLQADRLLAAERLVQFMAAVEYHDFPYRSNCGFIRSLEIEKNRLRLELCHEVTSCYDGGAGGTWDYYEYADLERLDEDWSLLRAEYGLSETSQFKFSEIPSYRGIFHGEDCECLLGFWKSPLSKVLRCKSIYLRDPFGLCGIYRFQIHWESF